jgi:hypothetical protein
MIRCHDCYTKYPEDKMTAVHELCLNCSFDVLKSVTKGKMQQGTIRKGNNMKGLGTMRRNFIYGVGILGDFILGRVWGVRKIYMGLVLGFYL